MRRLLRHAAFIAALLAFGAAAPASAQIAGNAVIDEVVALVGDKIVLKSDVDGFAVGLAQQRGAAMNEELWLTALERILDQKVLAVHARKDTTLQVTEEQVEQALDGRIDQLVSQLGGQARLEELYGKSTIQIKDDLREEFKDQMLAEQYQGKRLRQIRVTPSEVREWFSQFPTDSLPTLPDVVRLAHIVRYPDVGEGARAEAAEIITAIRDSLLTGRFTFEQLAEQYSDDLASARSGGRDSGRRLNELVPEFSAIASRIPIGEISQIFETQFGLHFLRINDRKGDVIDYNHILIQFDDSKVEGTQAMSYLNTVRDSLLQEEMPFEIMARRHSQEAATANRGGRVVDPSSGSRDLPLQALGPTWQATIAELKEGQISLPAEVELLDGRRAFHILLLQKRVPSHQVDILTDYERIEQIALQDKQSRELREWLNGLRRDVYVDLRGTARELTLAQNP